MTRQCALAVPLAALLVMALPSPTPAQELLIPLTGAEEADARLKNDYYIRKSTYGAKRYRLVKVNTDLLKAKGEISISLFDGQAVRAEARSVDIDTRTGSIAWTGQIIQKMLRKEDLVNQLGSAEAAETAFAGLTRVSIGASLFETDEASGANLGILIDPMEILAPVTPNRFEEASKDPRLFYGVNATFTPQIVPGVYVLEPLGMGGPYHLLYEIDKAKSITPVDGFADGVAPDAEQLEKMQKYEEFLEALGEDPREAIIIDRLRQAELLK